ARLYEETRTRVGELEQLTALAEAIAAAGTLEELLPMVAARSQELLRADACHLHLLEPGTEELEWRASSPAGEPRRPIGLAELGPELARGGRAARLSVPLVAGDELVGLLVAEGSRAVDLARAVASQTAVGIKKIQLIERLTEKNLIKDFFEELAGGRSSGDLEGRAARLGCDRGDPPVRLASRPGGRCPGGGRGGGAPGVLLRPPRRLAAGAAACSRRRRRAGRRGCAARARVARRPCGRRALQRLPRRPQPRCRL